MPRAQDEPEIKEKLATWERHWQTLILGLIAAGLMFVGKFMWDVNSQLSAIVTENKTLSITVAELKGAIAAMQTTYVTRNEFVPYTERIKSLEERRR